VAVTLDRSSHGLPGKGEQTATAMENFLYDIGLLYHEKIVNPVDASDFPQYHDTGS
jgi:hypothetical protein